MTTQSDKKSDPATITLRSIDGVEWDIRIVNPDQVPLNATRLEVAWYKLQRELHRVQTEAAQKEAAMLASRTSELKGEVNV